jgi:hypothetical protein
MSSAVSKRWHDHCFLKALNACRSRVTFYPEFSIRSTPFHSEDPLLNVTLPTIIMETDMTVARRA